jgi:DNA-binding transcriptional ArsR family regulator
MNWAKLPSAWVRFQKPCPLNQLSWRRHRSQGTASLMLLIALSIKLNMSHRNIPAADQTAFVAVTYDELQTLTGFARATISKGLMLLQAMGAVKIHKIGRSSVYELAEILENGKYCQVPQAYLFDGTETIMRRLTRLPTRTRACLNAMKLYVLFLAYRDHRFDTTAIGYESIIAHSGMRRADIPEAFALLVAGELARASDVLDGRDEDKSKRYRELGLKPVHRVKNDGEAAAQIADLIVSATTTL